MGLNLFFLGKSGVGKTSLMKRLACISQKYYIPKILVTRGPRFDDVIQDFLYVSVEEFEKTMLSGDLFLSMGDGYSYYGYSKKQLSCISKETICLMYGSPFVVDVLKNIGLTVLVDGDADTGLFLRSEDFFAVEERRRVNHNLGRQFYENIEFRRKMDIVFKNTFCSLDLLARQLNHLILEKANVV
jgi:energy-coupling factor transporter ATP-binding protein EcfA2